jgi:putative nucleic acid binding protein
MRFLGKLFKWALIGFGALVLLAVVLVIVDPELAEEMETASVESEPRQSDKAADPVEEDLIEISARDLLREYEKNEVAADLKYDGKYIIVSGSIVDIGTSTFASKPTVELGGSGIDMFDEWTTLTFAECVFLKTEAENVASLEKGQTVRLKGRVLGLTYKQVAIRDCSLESVE